MGKLRHAALALTLLLGACASSASLSAESRPNLLTLSPEQQRILYGSMETAYPVETIRKGTYVRPLPLAVRQISPRWTFDGREQGVEDYMAENRLSGVLVLKDGKILLERYGLGRKPEDRWTSFSVAKSVTSTLVGAAIQDGKIKSLDDVVTNYIPALKGSAYEGVTIRQLLTMSSGVRWNEDYTDPNSDVARAGTAFREPGQNPIVSYMSRLPRANTPGAKFTYNTGETDLVGVLVSTAVGKSLAEYASEKIWGPFGMERDGIWLTDTSGHERGGCCMSMTLRDYARFGLFVLEDGVARGQRILPEGWVKQATTPQIKNGAPPPGYGYFWWMRDDGGYEAVGSFGQSITTFPEDGLIIVTNAAWPTAGGANLYRARDAFVRAAHAAAKGM